MWIGRTHRKKERIKDDKIGSVQDTERRIDKNGDGPDTLQKRGIKR